MLPGSGGSSGSGAASKQRATLTLRLNVPMNAGSSAQRRPKYISPATTQITVNIIDAVTSAEVTGYPITQPLTPTSTGCSSTLASTICTLTLSVPVSADSYALSVAMLDASSTVLSQTQSVPFTIVQGAANQLNVSLGGLATSLSVLPLGRRIISTGAGFSVYGNFASQFEVLPLDADNNLILGAGAPVPTVTLMSGAHASLTPPTSTNPNLWTITPSYQATDPTVPTGDTLQVSATPVPSSGGSTVTTSAPLAIYQPWIYLLDKGNGEIDAYDETGAATLSAGAFTGGALSAYVSGMTYAQGSLYVVSGYNHGNGRISSYALTGGSPTRDVTDGTAGFAGIDGPMYPNSIAYDPHNQQLYVGDSGYNAGTYSVDAALTSGVQATDSGAGVGPYGFAFDPATNQMIGPSQTGGLLVCSEALSCSSSGSSLNAFGIAYDATRGDFGVGAPNCCGSAGGINFEDVSGDILGTTGSASADAPNSLAYDQFSDSWYFWRNGVGMNNYTTAGVQLSTSFGLPVVTTVPSIVLVP